MTWRELEKFKPLLYDKLIILGQGFIILRIEVNLENKSESITFGTIKERDYEAYMKHHKVIGVSSQYKTEAEAEGIECPEMITWKLEKDRFSHVELLKETTLVRAKSWMKELEQ